MSEKIKGKGQEMINEEELKMVIEALANAFKDVEPLETFICENCGAEMPREYVCISKPSYRELCKECYEKVVETDFYVKGGKKCLKQR